MIFSALKFLRKRKKPTVPEGVGLYVTGDIHGRADCLEAVFDKIDSDPRRANFDRCVEIYLGDYVDRGPDSRRVLTLLIERANQKSIVTLRGNHETMMQAALADDAEMSDWCKFGGLETMSSYGVAVSLPLNAERISNMSLEWRHIVPNWHKEFLENLVHTHEEGDYFFVHAGVRPGVLLANQSVQDLLWIREEFLESSAWHGKVIVHGHTPVQSAEFLSNRINIDTGAYITGNLTCLRLHGGQRDLL